MTFTTFGFQNTIEPSQEDFNGSPEYLGGKGAGLVWMSYRDIPVPPGFVIPTTVWEEYDKSNKKTLTAIKKALPEYIQMLINHFGYLPLLSVRSGAKVSMPGMLDTILNVGIDETNFDFWENKLGKECYESSLHRLITMYGSVVKGLNRQELEKGDHNQALSYYTAETGETFPNMYGQLMGAVEAVFKSWDNDRAEVYRRLNKIPREWGTAVTIQAMVFGNLNDKSGTGVLFTRNPNTGEHKITGEFLINAQGEDVVAGIKTPLPLEEMYHWDVNVSNELIKTVTKLESLKKDVQDVEFTVQDGKLFILQTRNAKRTPLAAIRIAVEMAEEGLITEEIALSRVSPRQYDLAQQSIIDPAFKEAPDYEGIAACSGAVTGIPVFTSLQAKTSTVPCILVTEETNPDDIAGMHAAVGIITMNGGTTSHAAVVARSMNKPCITGVGAEISAFEDFKAITMDGGTGAIWPKEVPIVSGVGNEVLHKYNLLLSKVFGIIPVIDRVPAYHLEKAVLVLGVNKLNPVKAVELVEKVAMKVGKLYLEFDPDVTEAEENFLAIFDTYEVLVPFFELLAKKKHLEKTVVVLGGENKVSPLDILPGFEFKVLSCANDLHSIILSDNELVLTGDEFSDPAIVKVLKWKKAEGQEVFVNGTYFQGLPSAISLEQALQLHVS